MNGRDDGETSDVLAGQVIGDRFRLERIVSESSASTLYVAHDETTGTSVNLRLFTAETTRTSRDELIGRATRAKDVEHRTLTPIVHVGDAVVDGSSRVFVVSARPAGGTLQDMLDRGRRLSPSQAVVVGVAVCRALDRAHREGLVHLDLRPSAIAFDAERTASLSEVGAVSAVAERAWGSPSDVSIERARYASPEQASGGEVTGKSDVYSLALVLSEAITGVVPFLADSVVATLAARQDRLFPVTADLGPLASVLERAGRSDAGERFDAADMGRALVQAAGSLPRPTPPSIVFVDGTGDMERPVVDASLMADGPAPGIDVVPEPSESETQGSAVSHPEPRVGRWVAAAFAVLALVVGGFFVYRAVSDETAQIPDLVGLDEGAATNAVTRYGWRVETIEEFDDEAAVGSVIRTEPETGTSLTRDGVLVLVLSSGPRPVPLPDLVGMDAEEAIARLVELGLEVRRVDGFSEDVTSGAVASWQVATQPNLVAGDEVVKGTVIDVNVSTGPEPRVVPELRGLTADEASAVLDEMRLLIRRVEDQFFVDVPAGVIGFQVPPPGEATERDSEVTVVVSKGPDVVTVPVLTRLDHERVVKTLTDAGLVVGSWTGNTTGVLVAILADGQPITSGQIVARGTVVELAYFGS